MVLLLKGHVRKYDRRDGTHVREHERQAPRRAPSLPETIAQFIGKVAARPHLKGVLFLRAVSDPEAAAIVARGGPDTRGMIHVLDADSVRHSMKAHGDPNIEENRRQIPLTAEVLSQVQGVLDAPIRIDISQRRNGWSIAYTGKVADAFLTYVARVIPTSKRKRPRLVMKTAWVGPSAGVESSPAPVYTPERSHTLPPESSAGKESDMAKAMILFLKARAPTPAQLAAGNYKKQHIQWRGLDVSIENPKGSVRAGVDEKTGRAWRVQMAHDYGYIRRTRGADGDHVDCFIGPDRDAPYVFLVHQRKAGQWHAFDETKCMLNFSNKKDAMVAYLGAYDDPRFMGEVEVLTAEEFIARVRATWERGHEVLGSPP